VRTGRVGLETTLGDAGSLSAPPLVARARAARSGVLCAGARGICALRATVAASGCVATIAAASGVIVVSASDETLERATASCNCARSCRVRSRAAETVYASPDPARVTVTAPTPIHGSHSPFFSVEVLCAIAADTRVVVVRCVAATGDCAAQRASILHCFVHGAHPACAELARDAVAVGDQRCWGDLVALDWHRTASRVAAFTAFILWR
jgi:hypothetical protein